MSIVFRAVISATAILTASICFAQEENADGWAVDFAAIEAVLENAENCIGMIDDDRIYLREDRLFLEGGLPYIELNDEGDSIQLPLLGSDARGSFLRDALSMRTAFDLSSPCPLCGRKQIIHAFGCDNPNCPSHENLAEYNRQKEEKNCQAKERKQAEKRAKEEAKRRK